MVHWYPHKIRDFGPGEWFFDRNEWDIETKSESWRRIRRLVRMEKRNPVENSIHINVGFMYSSCILCSKNVRIGPKIGKYEKKNHIDTVWYRKGKSLGKRGRGVFPFFSFVVTPSGLDENVQTLPYLFPKRHWVAFMEDVKVTLLIDEIKRIKWEVKFWQSGPQFL